MNWSVFAIFAYVLLALQTGAAPMLEIPTRFGDAAPQFVLVLGVIVGLFAPPRVVYWAWAVLGLLVDATMIIPRGPSAAPVTLIGPHVLAYLAAAFVMLQLRSMVFRQHPFSTGFAILVAGAAAEMILVLIFSIRGMYEPMPGFAALTSLALRGISLLYTSAVGVALAVPMLRLVMVFGFPTAGAERTQRSGR